MLRSRAEHGDSHFVLSPSSERMLELTGATYPLDQLVQQPFSNKGTACSAICLIRRPRRCLILPQLILLYTRSALAQQEGSIRPLDQKHLTRHNDSFVEHSMSPNKLTKSEPPRDRIAAKVFARVAKRSKNRTTLKAYKPLHGLNASSPLSADAAAKVAIFKPYLQAERLTVITGSDTSVNACNKSPLLWLTALSLTILQFQDSAPRDIESHSIRHLSVQQVSRGSNFML